MGRCPAPTGFSKWLRDLGESGAVHVEDLGLLKAKDPEIFEKARQAEAVVITNQIWNLVE